MFLEISWCNALLILRLGQRDTHLINLVGQGFYFLKRPSRNVLANLRPALMLQFVGQPTFPDLQIANTVLLKHPNKSIIICIERHCYMKHFY
jgi:hypothetical protein